MARAGPDPTELSKKRVNAIINQAKDACYSDMLIADGKRRDL